MASSSSFPLQYYLFLFSTATFSLISSCSSLSYNQPNVFNLPIKKDPLTNLYYASVGIGTPRHNFDLVVDLGGPNLWYDCDSHYNSSSNLPIIYDSPKCPQESGSLGCEGPFKTGCSNDTCAVYIVNIFAQYIFNGFLGEDVLYMPTQKVPSFLSGCIEADAEVLQGLPKGSDGIIGLARTKLALPAQISSAYKLPRRFSLCLPSLTNNGCGDLIIGTQDVSDALKTTSLIINPNSTAPAYTVGTPSYEYFIDVKSVKIDGEVVNIKPSLLSFDKNGNGGTRLSTMVPFTELQSKVYRTFLRHFLKQASNRKLKRVNSVAPFEACYDSSSVIESGVPSIDLELQGGVSWTFPVTNMMVATKKKNVVCLGFVDGGTEPKMSGVKASIVIGGYQLENNLLVFDLESSKLSFSSSLLLQKTSSGSRF